MTAQPIAAPRFSFATLLIAAVLGLAAVWAYWPTLARMAGQWADDPQYSHGYLVPVFALYLLWLRREQLDQRPLNAGWLGLGLLVLAVALRLAGARYSFEYLDQISLLPGIVGLFLLAGGWSAFTWSWPAIAFLIFMIPLPYSVSNALSRPLQAFATEVSTVALQVLGKPALAEGNVILLNDIELNIVEACSGLRMLFVFFALSTAVAMLIGKPLWEKLLIGASAVPIALASNVLRITITGLFYDAFGNHFGGAFLHDLAGWLMMPLGLLFLVIELWILKMLLIERSAEVVLASQISLQRVEVNPLGLYEDNAPRRKKTAAETELKPMAVAVVETAEPIAQS